MNVRPAPRGERTVYVEHGVWYDPKTKHIHVTLYRPRERAAHWSYSSKHPRYALYRAVLIDAGRWPEEADE